MRLIPRLRNKVSTMKKTKTIKVDYLARVEGEGALHIQYDADGVNDVQLKIFEPPRFFEALLRGRDFREAPDITARICGICPVAYQMSAVHALENALDITVSEELRQLRRLLYCGEWIESHGLHIYMLHAPDFLGYESAIAMAKDHPQLVQKGLQLKKAGNAIVQLLGGREIHPINVRVGGFYRAPLVREFDKLREDLSTARNIAADTVRWSASLSFPDFTRPTSAPYEYVALSHPHEYPMNEGRIISSNGLNISQKEFETFFIEEHVAHSNALHCLLKARDGDPGSGNQGSAYLVGPMARFSLNADQLSEDTRRLAADIGFKTFSGNPFHSIVVRSLEVFYAFDEALRIINNYRQPEPAWLEPTPKAAIGYGATEAPRGLLYHRYTLGEDSKIVEAKIVAPTSQNQKTIENDLRELLPGHLQLPEDTLRPLCEQAIRNHDPCISCAAHFLQLHLEKRC